MSSNLGYWRPWLTTAHTRQTTAKRELCRCRDRLIVSGTSNACWRPWLATRCSRKSATENLRRTHCLTLSLCKQARKLREDFDDIADDTEISKIEDWCIFVLVNGNDVFG